MVPRAWEPVENRKSDRNFSTKCYEFHRDIIQGLVNQNVVIGRAMKRSADALGVGELGGFSNKAATSIRLQLNKVTKFNLILYGHPKINGNQIVIASRYRRIRQKCKLFSI